MENLDAVVTITLLDPDFTVLALIDDPLKLEYTKKINDVSSMSFSLYYYDSRVSLFELDCIVILERSIEGVLDPYPEFVGFCRGVDIDFQDLDMFKITIVGTNDLLARKIINYQAGTVKAYKNDVAETVMKEYVEENCGASATTGNERQINGTLENFEIEPDRGIGDTWEGDRAYENLLDVLKDIAKFSEIDFDVVFDQDEETFTFRVYSDQLGIDRTTVGLDPSSGHNSAGNSPFIFSKELGNVKKISYSYNRVNEVNVISVLGEGELSTRDVEVRSTSAKDDSKWNYREVSRGYSGSTPVIGTTQNELQTAGDEALNELKSIIIIGVVPVINQATVYRRDFSLGDKITIQIDGVDYHRRITSVKYQEGPPEIITLEFGENR